MVDPMYIYGGLHTHGGPHTYSIMHPHNMHPICHSLRHRSTIEPFPLVQGKLASLLRLLQLDNVNVNHVAGYTGTALHIAVRKRRGVILRALLAHQAVDPNTAFADGVTPLQVAAQLCLGTMAATLSAHPHTDPNKPTTEGWSPLLQASAKGCLPVTKFLLRREDCDVNAADSKGVTPLIAAAQNGHVSMVKILIGRSDLRVNQATRELNITALIAATMANQHDAVEVILRRKDLDVNARRANGDTALHIAAFFGHTRIVQSLLEVAGINVHQANMHGRTPLTYAEQQPHCFGIASPQVETTDIRAPSVWKLKRESTPMT